MSAHYLHRLIEQCWMLSQVLGSLRIDVGVWDVGYADALCA